MDTLSMDTDLETIASLFGQERALGCVTFKLTAPSLHRSPRTAPSNRRFSINVSRYLVLLLSYLF